MRSSVFVIWQSLVVAAYRSFYAQLAQKSNMRIALAAPDRFLELGSQEIACQPVTPPFAVGDKDFPFFILPAWRPHIQIVWFKGLKHAMQTFFADATGPRIVVCAAEPYAVTTLIAWCTARLVLGRNFRFVCFALQNIYKKWSPPIAAIQNFIFKHSDAILSLGSEQEDVLRRHGYKGKTIPFPLWFDSTRFVGNTTSTRQKIAFGYAGSLTKAKGVDDLLACFEKNATRWLDSELVVAGAGPLKDEVIAAQTRLAKLGFTLKFEQGLSADAMPQFYSGLDVLIVPSKTTSNWKEQFGRVIIEAQACGAVVIGSDSGEIPHVIGERKRVFKEGDVAEITRVIDSCRQELGQGAARNVIRSTMATQAMVRYSDKVLADKFAAALAELK